MGYLIIQYWPFLIVALFVGVAAGWLAAAPRSAARDAPSEGEAS